MTWFNKDNKNFTAFAKHLLDKPNAFYESEFISQLLEQEWAPVQSVLIKKYFSSYMIYLVCSIVYMKLSLTRDSEDEFSIGLTCLGIVTFLMWLI